MLNNMSKKNIVVMTMVVLALVILSLGFWQYKTNNKANSYSVVYLKTGEVYIGKLTRFPGFHLKDSYILQVIKDTTDPAKSNFQLQPTSEVIWAPQKLHLIKDNIVFYGPLMSNSEIAETIAAQGK